ncbi:MAG: hypothetical protein JXK93_12460 [Sphaerochaetaceae bacterium]|nr:hypothetical protein [Sphaerochaetaceae bacterium]
MSHDYFRRVNALTATRCWVNNPTEQEALNAIEAGMTNCTTNPTYTMKQIQREPDLVHPIIDEVCRETDDDHRAAALIQRACVKQLMSRFEKVFDPECRMDGLVSLQGDPMLEHDPDAIIAEALESRKLGPNYLAKIPTTRSGLEAMKFLIAQDIPIIATEVMSISQMVQVCELYLSVSEATGKKPPIFITHITGIFDDYIAGVVTDQGIDISEDIVFQAGTVVARKFYRLFKERGYPGVILGGGARGLHHFTEFVGGDMHITINWKNTADRLIELDGPVIERIDTPTPDYVIQELTDKIPDFSRAWQEDGIEVDEFESYGPVVLFRDSFIHGWQFLLDEIRKRR